MITKLIEATDLFNHGKFLVCQLEPLELKQKSVIEEDYRNLSQILKVHKSSFWVLDCATGEGAFFDFDFEESKWQLQKHGIWVCPMYPLFLQWAFEKYKQNSNFLEWESLVNFEQGKHNALYRERQTPNTEGY